MYFEGPHYVDWNATEAETGYPPDTPGCRLYNFIMYAVLGGSVCLLGCVGNLLAFIVFWRDKIKTSTSLLFQVKIDLSCGKTIKSKKSKDAF